MQAFIPRLSGEERRELSFVPTSQALTQFLVACSTVKREAGQGPWNMKLERVGECSAICDWLNHDDILTKCELVMMSCWEQWFYRSLLGSGTSEQLWVGHYWEGQLSPESACGHTP